MTIEEKKKRFSKRYDDLFDYLYRYVHFRIVNKTEAEDIVSVCFLHAYERLDVFDPKKGNLKQWLTGIAKNQMLMYWRRKKIFVDLDEIEEIAGDKNDQTDRIDASMKIEYVFDRLKEKDRVFLTMRHIDGLSHDEIAQEIGKQPAAVRKYFSRLNKRIQTYA
ncbi:MAG: hypothetical protein CMI52_00925 [Parcubacteria group bacterium]|nr:hypothetical protein [Parcubacteria group bacterium]|tara:strand:- start:296 stop:784 length:489 start_codon:yes stop_codon:yes gene_type:complete